MRTTTLVVAIVVVGYGVLQATAHAEPVPIASASLSGHGASATSSGAFTKPQAAAISATAAGWGQNRPLSASRAHPAARPAEAAERQGNNQAAGITPVSASAIAAFNPLTRIARPRATVSAAWGFNQPMRVNRGVGSLRE